MTFLATPEAAAPLNLSRRGLLGAAAGALVLGLGARPAASQATPAAEAMPNPFAALLELRADGTARLQMPFVEGGQGVSTALAQILGEELDLEPARLLLECAPPGARYKLPGAPRVTGGSSSVRTSIAPLRRLGATARAMLVEAAAIRLEVPAGSLTTEPGFVVHAASGRRIGYGELAEAASAQPVPAGVTLRDRDKFRWIGKPVARLDVRAKSTGKMVYGIDLAVEGMLQAAVQHAPRYGMEPAEIRNEAAVLALPGVHSLHRLPGAVAVVADRWWRAHRAAETLQVAWREAAPGAANAMPADFSTRALRDRQQAAPGPGITAETAGDASGALKGAARVVEASYDAPLLAHGQLEPPSALASWNAEAGTLELWVPNQAPDMYLPVVARAAGIAPEKVTLHSPPLGGFFGRHFLYEAASPFPQAIALTKATGRPVKVIWSREAEFLRDAFRPAALVRFRGGIDASGLPVALEAEIVCDHLLNRTFGAPADRHDRTVVEGIANKVYAFPNRRVAHVVQRSPAMVGFWRSVGHSYNDFFMECFLDELAEAGQTDPFALRQRLVEKSPRHQALLAAVAELSGGWKRGPFTAPDGSRRARGIALSSPFGTEVATIAEVSIQDGRARAHDVWVAIDPGSIVNPSTVVEQVQSAVAIGLSSALLEEVVYEHGTPRARNYDGYPILPPDQMPRVHVRIIESGAPMGGVGEPGVPGVPPAVVNAVFALTGQRIRSLPLSRARFGRVS
ncbi:isoquinoline 1-oxidoreductase [Pseudoroseomonas deserti]|uniref:Isoquinoline 1-oxidoreductase n=1 Tax=Teichococcus deserti TaxID=1817963 RepID=A0A1V2H4U9_9PROT|nr:molybdopterin cofactor-binding domain-containing protein [Pseudoroseomonas deserti]ONG56074.1 isoquinoline 1-oxidoreductase [Pseudoroseomonas deserti]